MTPENTANHGDIRLEAEHASSPELVNTTAGQQEIGSIAAWGSNHATNTTVPTASLYWRGEVHDDSKNSHKFYTVTVTGSFVMRIWGRIAGYGSKAIECSKPEEFNSEEEAIASASSTILKKCARGYDTVEVNQ